MVSWHYHASSEHEFGYRHTEISFWEYQQAFFLNKKVNIEMKKQTNQSGGFYMIVLLSLLLTL